jgi:hypothetical protein
MYDFHPLSFIFKYFKIKITMSLFTIGEIRSREIDEGQTIQWTKEKGQKNKQWPAKHYTEDYNTNPITPGVE